MNTPSITPDAVAAIHAEYCRMTDQEGLSMRYDRISGWANWLRAGFTLEDLRLVVRYLRAGIAQGKRNEGALKWRNLVLGLDTFEEDLYEARRVARARRPRPAMAERRQALPGGGERLVDAESTVDVTNAGALFAKMRAEMLGAPAADRTDKSDPSDKSDKSDKSDQKIDAPPTISPDAQ